MKLLQYNTHLFRGTIAKAGEFSPSNLFKKFKQAVKPPQVTPKILPDDLKDMPSLTVYKDAERLYSLGEWLAKSDFDLICLEEVWARESQDYLRGRLSKAGYTHCYADDSGALSQGSGLIFFSRLVAMPGAILPGNMTLPPFSKFDAGSGMDGFSGKGFMIMKVIAGPTNGAAWIIQTHTQADYDTAAVKARAKQMARIAAVANILKAYTGIPVFVVGDMNVIGESKENKAINRVMSSVGLVDSYRKLHPDAAKYPGYTYDGRRNELIPLFAPKDRVVRQRLDYMYAPKGKVKSAVVLDSFNFQAKLSLGSFGKISMDFGSNDLSDHYPMAFTIKP